MTTDDPFRCICPLDPDDLIDGIPRAVEGCPAHLVRYAFQQVAARLFADPTEVRAEGGRNCGCTWQILGDGAVRFTMRCDEHEPMCRTLERWELDIVRPGDRVRVLTEHQSRRDQEAS